MKTRVSSCWRSRFCDQRGRRGSGWPGGMISMSGWRGSFPIRPMCACAGRKTSQACAKFGRALTIPRRSRASAIFPRFPGAGLVMEKFTTLTGVAAPLPMINVDTDKIIPKQHLKTVERTGLGKALFEELRYRADGSENPDFVLNQPAYRQAKILVAGENFGCGSSREHAPWALMDFGIRCVIAPSFADIFYNNSFKNGMLLIKLPQQVIDELMEDAKKGANARLSVDLASQTVTRPDGEKIHFELDPHLKHCLLEGLDDIGLTLKKEAKIASFEGKRRLSQPWL